MALTTRKITLIGLGKIGETILSGLQKKGVPSGNIRASKGHAEGCEELSAKFGISVTADNRAQVSGADIAIFCTKPQKIREAIESCRDALDPTTLVVSVAAGTRIAQLEEFLGGKCRVVRAMPNTPALIGAGMTVLSKGSHATNEDLHLAEEIFKAVGRTTTVDEYLMDAVTGLSGSGPAYIYVIIESLAEAGVKLGIPRDKAILLAAQTCFGAAKMTLELGEHPALLKDSVTTPAGCTVDGLLKLEEGGLRVTLIKAVVEAAKRASELG
ncbi:MAG: pyrroline-5-carboxylate reductase [Planctomycetes bacterium]|nr:pyrroline-5-carboxylate reductase [Planctomycetota bacterium]